MPGGLVLSPSGSGASNSTPPVPLSGTGGWFYHTSGGQGPAFLFYIAHRNRLPGLPQGMLWRTPEHGLNAEEPAADQIRRPFFPVRPRLQFFLFENLVGHLSDAYDVCFHLPHINISDRFWEEMPYYQSLYG